MNFELWKIKRTALRLRQRDVAERTGISQARYSLLERGEAVPTNSETVAIDRCLQLDSEIVKKIANMVDTSKSP